MDGSVPSSLKNLTESTGEVLSSAASWFGGLIQAGTSAGSSWLSELDTTVQRDEEEHFDVPSTSKTSKEQQQLHISYSTPNLSSLSPKYPHSKSHVQPVCEYSREKFDEVDLKPKSDLQILMNQIPSPKQSFIPFLSKSHSYIFIASLVLLSILFFLFYLK